MRLPKQKKTLQQIIEENDLCISGNSRGTDKLYPHNYIRGFYEFEFKKYQDKNIDLLEVGFRHGASLHLWSKFFSKGRIYGADNSSDVALTNENPVNRNWLNDPKIETFIGDAYDYNFSSKISQKFDIIIDDGPHTLVTQIMFLKLYLPKLKEGGVAIIEDLQNYGSLCFWPLMINTPFKYHIEFYDLRTKSSPHDDLLFVVRNKGTYSFGNRAIAFLTAVYIGTKEIMARIFGRVKKSLLYVFAK